MPAAGVRERHLFGAPTRTAGFAQGDRWLLFRVSSIDRESEHGFAIQQKFVADIVASASPAAPQTERAALSKLSFPASVDQSSQLVGNPPFADGRSWPGTVNSPLAPEADVPMCGPWSTDGGCWMARNSRYQPGADCLERLLDAFVDAPPSISFAAKSPQVGTACSRPSFGRRLGKV